MDRRLFLGSAALSVAYFTVPGAFAADLMKTPKQPARTCTPAATTARSATSTSRGSAGS